MSFRFHIIEANKKKVTCAIFRMTINEEKNDDF